MLNFESARAMLDKVGQAHVLRFWDRLGDDERRTLLDRIEGIDFSALSRMRSMLGKGMASGGTLDLRPAEVVELFGRERSDAVIEGERAIASGETGVLLVAGGQGSRLGFEGPKGAFPIGPVSNATLFEIHSRKILALERKYRAHVPLYVMTSEANDAATREFFDRNGFFGLSPQRVRFFVQGMWPALDGDGLMVLEAPGRLFMSPDGHGGVLGALAATGSLADMKERGLKTLFYFQVDNPLVEISDPAFIGLHISRKADVSVKVCAKRDPDEGLGVVVVRGKRNAIVEYTELTKEQKHARAADGKLRFLYGSVAIHVFSLDFLIREVGAAMPLHAAHKKVPTIDAAGNPVRPSTPNAYKFEKFIFDVLPDADRAVNLAFAREDEFSPVKNAEGDDSPATTRRDMTRKCGRWLAACGARFPLDKDSNPAVALEIDPCYALGPEDLKAKLPRGFKVESDLYLTDR